MLSLAGEAAKLLELRQEIGHNIYIPHYWALTCAHHVARALLDILIPALVVAVGAMPSLRAEDYL